MLVLHRESRPELQVLLNRADAITDCRAGEAVLYGWIEAVREHLEDVLPEEAAPASLDGQIAAASRLEVAVETGVPPYANSIYFQCFNPTGCGLKKLRGIAPP